MHSGAGMNEPDEDSPWYGIAAIGGGEYTVNGAGSGRYPVSAHCASDV